MDDDADYGAKLSTWNALVRRARIGDPKKKLAALTFGSYAGNDGTSIRCGVSRFAADCEMGYSTARRYIAWLREVGLIELVRPGNRKAKRADEYRLTIAVETYRALEIPDEDEYRDLVDDMNSTNRAGEKGRRLRSPKASAEAREGEDSGGRSSALTSMASAETAICAHLDSFLRSPMSELPPPISTSQLQAPPTGGAPPPDPRRPPSPSGPGTEAKNSPPSPITEPPDRQRNSPSRAGAAHASEPSEVAPVVQLFPGAPRPRSRAAKNVNEASARIAAKRAARQAELAADTTTEVS